MCGMLFVLTVSSTPSSSAAYLPYHESKTSPVYTTLNSTDTMDSLSIAMASNPAWNSQVYTIKKSTRRSTMVVPISAESINLYAVPLDTPSSIQASNGPQDVIVPASNPTQVNVGKRGTYRGADQIRATYQGYAVPWMEHTPSSLSQDDNLESSSDWIN